jgi:nuclear cap-binding protein subunit 1
LKTLVSGACVHADLRSLLIAPLQSVSLLAENEHHLAAGRLETLLRSKTPPEAVIESLSQLPGQSVDQPWTAQTRSIALQTFLFIGSRSFSHFLNATERYLPLLRALATTAEQRMDVLRAVGTFWRSSGQMRVIVGDKLMQYGIVSGEDVVRWVFEEEEDGSREATAEQWMAGQKWDVLRMGVDKVNGRVVGVRRNLVRIEAEEEEKRGGRRAAMHTGEEEKDESAAGHAPDVDMDRSGASAASHLRRPTGPS